MQVIKQTSHNLKLIYEIDDFEITNFATFITVTILYHYHLYQL
jgi:hypothetical protein